MLTSLSPIYFFLLFLRTLLFQNPISRFSYSWHNIFLFLFFKVLTLWLWNSKNFKNSCCLFSFSFYLEKNIRIPFIINHNAKEDTKHNLTEIKTRRINKRELWTNQKKQKTNKYATGKNILNQNNNNSNITKFVVNNINNSVVNLRKIKTFNFVISRKKDNLKSSFCRTMVLEWWLLV